ncbi:MAG: hypothetical protein QOH72_68 [Solirubrobacteraceae bacterium]|jgi:hypothetical protein|nr:hypothetical protein [Solirubrobacteraceae bacterium]
MRRPLALPLAAAALAAAAVVPASAPAASWTAPRPAATAGASFTPSVAADARGRMAVGFVRQLRGRTRAEVRRGTTRGLLRGASLVLDSSTHFESELAVGLPSDGGPLAAAWRRFDNGAQRLFAATVSTAGAARTPQALAPDGTESAYAPAFVAGGDGSTRLVWTRRTTAAGRLLAGGAFGAPFALPAPGVGAEPRIAVDADGTAVVVWVDSPSGRVLASQAPAGGRFGPPTVLSATGRARDPQLAVSATGTAVAVWLQSSGGGNSVQAVARPRGGAFGAPFQIAEPGQRAFSPRIAATSAREVLVAWVNSNVTTGYGGGPGVVRLQRLGDDGAPVGARRQLTPDGVRTTEPALAHDGTGSVIVAWTNFPAGARSGTVQARRIAPSAILGSVRTLSRGPVENRGAPVLAGGAGRMVAAWTQHRDVTYSVYR